MYVEIIGPTLIDLKTRTNLSYEFLAVAVSGVSIGYLIGAVAGGFLIDKFGLFLDLALAVGLHLGAVGTVAILWIPNTQLLWLLCYLLGASTGIVNTCNFKTVSIPFIILKALSHYNVLANVCRRIKYISSTLSYAEI